MYGTCFIFIGVLQHQRQKFDIHRFHTPGQDISDSTNVVSMSCILKSIKCSAFLKNNKVCCTLITCEIEGLDTYKMNRMEQITHSSLDM